MSSQATANGARSVARKLALQALYQWQLNDCPWQDLVNEYEHSEDMPRADGDYFRDLIGGICRQQAELDITMTPWLDRAPALLDPVEHAVLLIGTYELGHRPDIPFRVVINEAVGLAKRFGATDGHKFINGVLDRAARELRVHEH